VTIFKRGIKVMGVGEIKGLQEKKTTGIMKRKKFCAGRKRTAREDSMEKDRLTR